jgi:hypothetical protein
VHRFDSGCPLNEPHLRAGSAVCDAGGHEQAKGIERSGTVAWDRAGACRERAVGGGVLPAGAGAGPTGYICLAASAHAARAFCCSERGCAAL